MDIPETLAILGTQYTGRRQNTKNTPQHRKLKIEQNEPPPQKKTGVNPGDREG